MILFRHAAPTLLENFCPFWAVLRSNQQGRDRVPGRASDHG